MTHETDEILTKREEAAKLAAIEEQQGWRHILSIPQGRRVIWEQLAVIGIYQHSTSMEPQALAYNEGRRGVGLKVMFDVLRHCPDLYDLMVVENRARLARENEA